MSVASRAALAITTALGAMAWAPAASAAPEEEHVAPPGVPEPDRPIFPELRHRTFGMSMDVGAPDGAALGLVVRPYFNWLRLNAAGTYNGLAPGVRVGVTLDPIRFPVAPTLTVEGGHYWQGTIPMVKDSPPIGYDYANFHLGLELGRRDSFRIFLRGGVSYVNVSTSNFKSVAGGSDTTVAIGDPTFSGWLAPSAKLGFAMYF